VPSTETFAYAAASVAAGLALALAYPNFEFTALAWTGLTPVIVIAAWRGPAAAFAWGALAGVLFFFTLLSWLNFTFSVYSAIPAPLVYVPTLALAAYCGLYVALFAAAVAYLAGRRSPFWALACAPFIWVAGEWVRGHLFGGFPWGLLGYSQYRELRVIQIAELGGVYAVSFVVVAANAALAGLFVLPGRQALVGLVSGGVLVVATLGFGAARLAQTASGEVPEVKVGIMQPAIEQPLKFDPNHAAQTLGIYLELTRRAARDEPQLLVWPETAMPGALRREPGLQRLLAELVTTLGMPLLVGSIDVSDGRPVQYRNSAFLVTERGIAERYDKIQLVPFGEYVPLSSLLGFVRGWAEFIADLEPGARPVVFSGPPAPFGVVICYEGIFPELVREFVKDGARFMVNMTNDAWFGRTSGPAQHLAMYPLRAVEHRTAVVRAANTGISALIAPSGRILRRLPLFERGTLTDRVPLRARTTLYTRWGDWLAWLSLAVTAGALGAARGRGSRPGTAVS
jgi:apolipoprotein N-acyltransferase